MDGPELDGPANLPITCSASHQGSYGGWATTTGNSETVLVGAYYGIKR